MRERPPKASWGHPPGRDLPGGLEVVAWLGGGRRTEVYRCRRRGATVVVKMLRPGRTGAADRSSLRHEAAMLTALDHPCLPRLLAATFDVPVPYLVLSDGLGDRLSRLRRRHGELDGPGAVRLAAQVADALTHVHARGMVHLDVKPGNVTWTDGRATLLDFGSALPGDRATGSGVGVGTPSYRAPEQHDASRGGTVGPPADVFALGVTLLRVTTGRNPLRARGAPDPPDEGLLVRRCHGSVRAAPPVLRRVIVACTALDPERRPAAVDLRDRLVRSVSA